MVQNLTPLSQEYKDIKYECDQIYDIVRTEKNSKKDEESIKILHRIIALLSPRQKEDVRNFTVSYMCSREQLSLVLVEILMETRHIQCCMCILDILAKLIMKNNTTSDSNRQIIRNTFSKPTNFNLVIEAFRKICEHFAHDRTNTPLLDVLVKLLKIINCLYTKTGQAQISHLSATTVDFLGCFLNRYISHRELSRSMLPLIKVLSRNKNHSAILCNDVFLKSLAIITPIANKYSTAVSILKSLSRYSDALEQIIHNENIFYFILSALNHVDKIHQQKCLISILNQITLRADNGIKNISNVRNWEVLLDFFSRTNIELNKSRLIAIKAYTILNRGVEGETMDIVPVKLNIKLSAKIQDYCRYKLTEKTDDTTDNEESEDEDDSFDGEDSYSENDVDEDRRQKTEDENTEENFVGDTRRFYREFYEDVPPAEMKTFRGVEKSEKEFNKLIENRIHREKNFNRQAFPDKVFAQSESRNSFIVPNINYFSMKEMENRIRILKSPKTMRTFQKKVVFDLDALIQDNKEIDLPDPDVQSNLSEIKNMTNNKKQCFNLKFESRFECGNLRRVEQVGSYDYNLFLSPDINMNVGMQWFYFQVSNMLPDQMYTFNIVNFQKVNSQFNYGLQPVMFSIVDFVKHKVGWRRVGEKMMYFGNEYLHKDNLKQFRTLTFSISFKNQNDYCYLAYHFPYSYTRMMISITPFLFPPDNIYARVDTLTCAANNLNEVPLITITAATNNKSDTVPLQKRPLVFITARVHPSESNSSWIMDGVLQYLLSQDEGAQKAREVYIFKIIPMLNPEGVIYGNSRCGLSGIDLNRCWKNPHSLYHPEIYYSKNLVKFAKEHMHQPIFTFIDIHGHSRKKYFFLYGCNPKLSWNDKDKSLANCSDSSYNMIPKAMEQNDNMKISFCRYSIEKKRETTCRVVMWREFGIKRSHTLECSFSSGGNKKKFTTQLLQDIGISIIKSLKFGKGVT